MWDDVNFNLSTDTEEINEKSFLLHIEVSEIQNEIKGAFKATAFELDQQTKTQVNCNLDNNNDALTVKWPSWKGNRGYMRVYWVAWNETPPKSKEKDDCSAPRCTILSKSGAGSTEQDHFTYFPISSPIITVLLMVSANHCHVRHTEVGHAEAVGVCSCLNINISKWLGPGS